MDFANISEVKARFGEAVEDDVAAQCVQICKMFNKSVEAVFFIWESQNLRFGNRRATVLNSSSLLGVKEDLQQRAAAENAKNKKSDVGKKQSSSLSRGGLMKSGGASSAFLGPARVKTESYPSFFPFPNGIEKRGPVENGRSDVDFTLEGSLGGQRAYRYMYEKISERSEVLDDRIEQMAQLVKDHYGVAELGDPTAITEEDVVVVGRITLDGDSSSSGHVKLNEASLALETSRAMGSGLRVPFKFETNAKIREGRRGAGGLGLFPGAIVALRGKNGGTGWFVATEILSLPVPKLRTKLEKGAGRTPFSMCIACGPFTSDADCEFTLWKDLQVKFQEEKPDVVLLVGPFVDVTHPAIRQGGINAPPAKMFEKHIMSTLSEYLDSKPGSLGIIVPSVRDILSDHAVFPQSNLDERLVSHPRIKSLPNPCRFKLNGVSFAVSSVDVLFHLRKEEFFKRAFPAEPEPVSEGSLTPTDAMTSLCRHVLEQRSYYPIFPVPQELSHEVNLDVTHSRLLDLCSDDIPDAPEVLFIPSRLKQFAKDVDGTTFVNPSFLTKRTYASLTFDDTSTEGPSKVEISKLTS